MKKVEIVIGSNYGDEGKGTVVARLTKENGGNTLNILTNGGSQRGHTVVTEIGTHKFQHFGSGTYHGAVTYISAFFIINPMQFRKEWDELVVKPVVYRDTGCRWSTPFDMMANAIAEEMKGTQASCRMGIWNTIRRSKVMETSFDRFVWMDDVERRRILGRVKKFYEDEVRGMSQEWRKLWDSEGIIDHYLEDCDFMFTNTIPVNAGDSELLDFDTYVFENGQGLLIGDTGRDTSDSTPSNTGLLIPSSVKIGLGLYDSNCVTTVHYVTRPYLTRHGDGYLQNERVMGSVSSEIREDVSNPYNDAQGRFRYGVLDIDSLRRRIDDDRCGRDFVLELTHCDEMDRTDEFGKKFENVVFTSDPLI